MPVFHQPCVCSQYHSVSGILNLHYLSSNCARTYRYSRANPPRPLRSSFFSQCVTCHFITFSRFLHVTLHSTLCDKCRCLSKAMISSFENFCLVQDYCRVSTSWPFQSTTAIAVSSSRSRTEVPKQTTFQQSNITTMQELGVAQPKYEHIFNSKFCSARVSVMYQSKISTWSHRDYIIVRQVVSSAATTKEKGQYLKNTCYRRSDVLCIHF